jgi:hypothetical protein
MVEGGVGRGEGRSRLGVEWKLAVGKVRRGDGMVEGGVGRGEKEVAGV